MVSYISSPVTGVLLAFLARHFTKNEVPEEEAASDPQKRVNAWKLNSQFAIFTYQVLNLKQLTDPYGRKSDRKNKERKQK